MSFNKNSLDMVVKAAMLSVSIGASQGLIAQTTAHEAARYNEYKSSKDFPSIPRKDDSRNQIPEMPFVAPSIYSADRRHDIEDDLDTGNGYSDRKSGNDPASSRHHSMKTPNYIRTGASYHQRG